MPFDQQILIERFALRIPIVLSLSVHEWAHAPAAWRLGVDTARLLGRITLDPLAHIDPLGTILLPLMGVPFGWAKPVPVNPLRLRGVTMPIGMMHMAAAGPIANVDLGVGAAVFYVLMAYLRLGAIPASDAIQRLLEILVVMNAMLAVFNLIPIPLLDGSPIVAVFVPRQFHGA
jgi:Zn-dependent protease